MKGGNGPLRECQTAGAWAQGGEKQPSEQKPDLGRFLSKSTASKTAQVSSEVPYPKNKAEFGEDFIGKWDKSPGNVCSVLRLCLQPGFELEGIMLWYIFVFESMPAHILQAEVSHA